MERSSVNIYIPPHVSDVMARLNSTGHAAHIVGGCVRDALRGVTPADHDVTTSALPDETVKIFRSAGYRVIETGIAHGTVTVLTAEEPIEITTYRIDGEYKDHRHPQAVAFTRSLKEDLARRDLTVNAMAYSEVDGLIDPFGGSSDLEKGVIRAVGDPEKRFDEDALRILRALRFASALDFQIDGATSRAMLSQKHLLSNISAERIQVELSKLIVGVGCERILTENAVILTEIIPELAPCVGFQQHNPHHIYDVYTHTVKAVQFCPPDRNLRFAALLHDCGKPSVFSVGSDGVGHFYGHSEKSVELAAVVLDRLKLDNASKKEILTLIRWHDPVIEETESSVGRWARRLGVPMLKKLLALKAADNLAQAPSCYDRLASYDRILRILDDIVEKNACFSLRDLAVNGDDLICELGMRSGKQLGDVLKYLLDAVISGKTTNDKQKLLELARSLEVERD